MKSATDEELEVLRSRAAGRTGLKGKIADMFDPMTRKRAVEAEEEIKRRQAERNKPAAPVAPAAPAKEFVFKKGGMVRGDGCATKGKTKGRFV
jgi:hypothetical protein